ncbi:MAG: hypothetical protein EPN85_14430 [Bacteroidetes bacterium]|nr:MAG: hypothetical protein EPN85_14430 [Bacteroidota bacterium]
MRTKTLVELLTLSTNLYMISKDEKFMENLSEMVKKGKKKAEDIIDEFASGEEESEDSLVQKFLLKAQKAKEELGKQIDEAAVKVYEKMHIAHSGEVKKLAEEIERLKNELALAEARIVNLEPRKT